MPSEPIELAHPKFDPESRGIQYWYQMFTPRQLLVAVTSVEVFQRLYKESDGERASEIRKEAFIYLAIAIDKVIDYNSKAAAWHSGREVMEHTFREHALVYKWAFAEMALVPSDSGADSASQQIIKCLKEPAKLSQVVISDLLSVDFDSNKRASIAFIERGESLRGAVERTLLKMPPLSGDPHAIDALELLAWMVANDILDVKVAVPCDLDRQPVRDDSIFHEKTGVIEDKTGDRLAFNGSINETEFGWTRNWESFNASRPGVTGHVSIAKKPASRSFGLLFFME